MVGHNGGRGASGRSEPKEVATHRAFSICALRWKTFWPSLRRKWDDMSVENSLDTVPLVISVDDHVVEPPDLWMSRLPRKYLEVGPRVVRGGSEVGARGSTGVSDDSAAASTDLHDRLIVAGAHQDKAYDCWVYEDLRKPVTRMAAAVSFAMDDFGFMGMTYEEMRPGCFQQPARLADMDLAGIEASLCFPNMFTRFCGQTFLEAKDHVLAQLCVEAYNDWMVEEWTAGSGGRLIPLCMVPLWDAELAAKEVFRNAERGVRAVCFSELPAHLGLPSIHSVDRYWDPFFQACNDTETVICLHVGSSSQVPITSNDAPPVLAAMMIQNNSYASLCDWLFSGVLARFADLKIAYSEGEIGWIPFLLERADWVWERQRAWAGVDRSVMTERPSTYYYEHVFGCFISDQHGIDSLEKVGADNVMFESDYPHSDTNWPFTREVAAKQLSGLTIDQRNKILRLNAIRLFSLDL